MSMKRILRSISTLALVAGICVACGALSACSLPQADAGDAGTMPENSSRIYGDWQNSSELVEEQLMRGSGTDSSGASSGTAGEGTSRGGHFRDTSEGEPVAIHQFINRVIVDDEYVKITLQSKTADELGDAGFVLVVENRYKPLTSVGNENYCYITPIMGTWSVNGVKMDPKTEGQVYPGKPGTLYLYFDELSTIEELVDIKGEFELYLISDWWNPVRVYELSQP